MTLYFDTNNRPNSRLLDPDRTRYKRWFQWANGKIDTLYTEVEPTAFNGLIYVRPTEVESGLNYFAACVRFYIDAMAADMPVALHPYSQLMQQLAYHWAVTGECIIIRDMYGLRAIRPDYFYPIPSNWDENVYVGYLFVFPLYNDQGLPTNRARVVEVRDGLPAIETERNYTDGFLEDALPGTGVTVPLTGLYWIQTGDGKIGEMSPLVRQINIRMSLTQHGLNKDEFPLLQIDRDNVADGQFSVGGQNEKNTAALHRTGLGVTVSPPYIGEEPPRYVERENGHVSNELAYMRLLLGQLTIASGVPDYVYGVNLGQPTAETERILFAGQAKVNRFRREIERFFETLGVNVVYAGEPFARRSTRIAGINALVEKGIISIQEARAALGIV